MKRAEILEKLLELAERVFDRVETTQGDFRGGVCRVRGQTCLFLNRAAGVDANLRTVANALAASGLDETYVLPALREAIDTFSDDPHR